MRELDNYPLDGYGRGGKVVTGVALDGFGGGSPDDGVGKGSPLEEDWGM